MRSLLLLLLVSFNAFAAPELLPIMDEKERKEWMKFLEENYPWTYKSNGYSHPPGSAVPKEQDFLKEYVLNNEEYMQHHEKRADLQIFKFGFVEVTKVSGMSLNKEEEPRIKKAKGHAPNASLKQIQNYSYNALLTGIVATLPGQHKGPIFKETNISKQLELVKKALQETDDETVKKNFKADRFGLDVSQITDQFLFELLESSAEATLDVTAYLIAETGLDQLNGAENGKNIVAMLLEESEELGHSLKGNSADFARVVSHWFEKSDNAERTTLTKEITLEELPPQIAIYRGHCGGDCSSSYSWAYSYSPYERTYLVRDKDVDVAYVSATILETEDGRSAFYIKDMQGPNMRAESIDQILLGFYQLREHLGVELLISPNQNFVYQNNSGSQADRIVKWTTNSGYKQTDVRFLPWDYEFREHIINNTVSGSYDQLQNYQGAYIMAPTAEQVARVGVEILEGSSAGEEKDKITSKELFTKLELSMQSGNSSLYGYTDDIKETYEKIVTVLKNDKSLTLEEFYLSANVALKELNIQVSNKNFNRNVGAFAQGHLNSPDAFKTKDKQMLSRMLEIIEHLLLRIDSSEKAEELISKNQKYFLSLPGFNELVIRMIQNPTPNHKKGIIAIERSMHKAYYKDILKNNENLRDDYMNSEVDALISLAIDYSIENKDLDYIRTRADIIDRIISLLDNEKTEDEKHSINAIKLLYSLGTDVNAGEKYYKELYRSARDEENSEIRARAALLILSHEFYDKRMRTHIHHTSILKFLRVSAKSLLRIISRGELPNGLKTQTYKILREYKEIYGLEELDKMRDSDRDNKDKKPTCNELFDQYVTKKGA